MFPPPVSGCACLVIVGRPLTGTFTKFSIPEQRVFCKAGCREENALGAANAAPDCRFAGAREGGMLCSVVKLNRFRKFNITQCVLFCKYFLIFSGYFPLFWRFYQFECCLFVHNFPVKAPVSGYFSEIVYYLILYCFKRVSGGRRGAAAPVRQTCSRRPRRHKTA